jgi:hypothetical protein
LRPDCDPHRHTIINVHTYRYQYSDNHRHGNEYSDTYCNWNNHTHLHSDFRADARPGHVGDHQRGGLGRDSRKLKR